MDENILHIYQTELKGIFKNIKEYPEDGFAFDPYFIPVLGNDSKKTLYDYDKEGNKHLFSPRIEGLEFLFKDVFLDYQKKTFFDLKKSYLTYKKIEINLNEINIEDIYKFEWQNNYTLSDFMKNNKNYQGYFNCKKDNKKLSLNKYYFK